LRRRRRLGKAEALLPEHWSSTVIGIYSIAIFIVVIAALNIFEFGRLD
jgi:hypothetical protein